MTGIFLDYLSIDPVYYISHVVLITFSICLHGVAQRPAFVRPRQPLRADGRDFSTRRVSDQ